MEIEIHPHQPFIPDPIRKLILGSFPGRATTLTTQIDDQWFYAAKRNQFWKIMAGVFETALPNQQAKEKLLKTQGIGITDILWKIRRKKLSNLDQDLEIISYNHLAIGQILAAHPDIRVFFTSAFVEKHFRKLFPEFKAFQRLPSPSPRYARLSLQDKIEQYKRLLIETPTET